MIQRRYLIFVWRVGDETAERQALSHLTRLEQGAAWRRLLVDAGWAVALPATSPLRARRILHGRGLVLGDFHPAAGSPSTPPEWIVLSAAARTSNQVFHQLSRRYWGRYVAVHQSDATAPNAVFRDPSGALDCLAWRQESLTIVASHLPSEALHLLPARAGLRWDIVGRHLLDPVAIAADVAIDGVAAVSAGEMLRLDDFTRDQVWSPATFVGAARVPRAELIDELRQRVRQVVTAHAGGARRILAEISGGLDSAIVATTLAEVALEKVAEWVNFHTPEAEGDERRFARAVAETLGLSLAEVSKAELQLTERRLDAAGEGARPSVAAIDYEYDEDNVARCAALGADTLITGQGGDAVFLQTHTRLIGADALAALLPIRALGGVLRDAAASARISVWSVARTALAARAGLGRAADWRPPPYVDKALAASLARRPAHPWLENLKGVPPVKRLQIHALAVAQLFHGHSRRGQGVDLIHPLLSQPLVEFALGVPSFDLALGSNDRALAREAFADELPEAVRMRRSKGDLTAYYGRMMTRSLNVVRPYLLEGLLVRERLVDRTFLEDALTEESLLWRVDGPGLIELIAIEAWSRCWTRVLAEPRAVGG